MAKKKSRPKYTSKGQRSPNKQISKMVRRDRTELEVHNDKLDAWAKGKTVYFTIANPDPKIRNKRFIRVNGRDLYGNPKKQYRAIV